MISFEILGLDVNPMSHPFLYIFLFNVPFRIISLNGRMFFADLHVTHQYVPFFLFSTPHKQMGGTERVLFLYIFN